MKTNPRSGFRDSAALATPGVGVKPTWEPWAFVILAVFFVAFGWQVLNRSAFSDRRRTDAGVFFRAGWAVREGIDPYSLTDENDWYYLYPPGMAVFMLPLADPPAGPPLPPPKTWWQTDERTSGGESTRSLHKLGAFLPYEVSVVIWYALGVACVLISVRCMSRALELSSPRSEIRDITRAHGGWWNLRFWPLIAVLPDIGSTLSRGQVNLFMLACICAGTLLLVRATTRARAWAGVLFSLAACIKVFPGVFVFELLLRRDWRAIRGYVACGVFCMILLPLVAFGPAKAIEHTWTFLNHVLLAGLGLADVSNLQAGSGPENTDNASIQGVLHNVRNIMTPRGQRPPVIETWIKLVHVAGSVALLGISLGAFRMGRRVGSSLPARNSGGLATCLRIGLISCAMLAAVPMCHRHYFMFMYPAIASLVFISMQRSQLALPNGAGLFAGVAVPLLLSLPKFMHEGVLRDLPIPLLVNLAIWWLCLRELRQLTVGTGIDPASNAERPRQAAAGV